MKQTAYTLGSRIDICCTLHCGHLLSTCCMHCQGRCSQSEQEDLCPGGTWHVLAVNLASQSEGAPFWSLFHSIWGQDQRTSATGKAT